MRSTRTDILLLARLGSALLFVCFSQQSRTADCCSVVGSNSDRGWLFNVRCSPIGQGVAEKFPLPGKKKRKHDREGLLRIVEMTPCSHGGRLLTKRLGRGA